MSHLHLVNIDHAGKELAVTDSIDIIEDIGLHPKATLRTDRAREDL